MTSLLIRLSAVLILGAPFVVSAQGAIIFQGGPFDDFNSCNADLLAKVTTFSLQPLYQDHSNPGCSCFSPVGTQDRGVQFCPTSIPDTKYAYNTVWRVNTTTTTNSPPTTSYPTSGNTGSTGGSGTVQGAGGSGTVQGAGGSGTVQGAGGSGTVQGGTGITLINPLKAANLMEFLLALIDIAIQIGYVVIVLMLVYVGYLFATTSINPENKKDARGYLVWTLVGALILLGSKAIALGIQATVNALN